MRNELINIRKSKGIRILKSIIQKLGMRDSFDLSVQDHSLVVTLYEDTRNGWEGNFQLMAKNNDDILLNADSFCCFFDDDE